MQKIVRYTIILLFFFKVVEAQTSDFEFGDIKLNELTLQRYSNDSNAVALVLNEFGKAFIDTDETYDLIVEYHVKIKILKQSGVIKGDVIIPLRKTNKYHDKINWIKASSYNLEDGQIVESKLEREDIFIEDPNKHYDLKKFSIPNLQQGTVLEYKYQLQTPFVFNFHPWEFQSDIPKLKSEYWAKFPANYDYNIALIGPLKLSKNNAEVIEKCVVISNGSYGQGTYADCTLLKFGMENIPAFKEEEYMTAKSNFLSRIDFELKEIRRFNGSVDKISKTWNDVVDELKTHKDFGLQLKRGKEVFKEAVQKMEALKLDSLTLAKEIYNHIQNRYQWDGEYGVFCKEEMRDSYERGKGGVSDINLALVTTLRLAGFKADPVILSTRENGVPKEIFPVISDFNYVIAGLKLQGRVYLLDATDDFLSFGTIPIRCLNGKGRVIKERESFWQDLAPSDKLRKVSLQNFVLNSAGSLKGTINNIFYGYEAVKHRKTRTSFQNQSQYLEYLSSEEYPIATLSELTENNLEDINLIPAEKFTIEIPGEGISNHAIFYLDPFLGLKKMKNPFVSSERLYPVDFGAPLDQTFNITFEIPDNFQINAIPPSVALALPNNGGRYQFEVRSKDHLITVNSRLVLTRAIYSHEEYHFLKELYGRIIEAQNSIIVLGSKQ